MASPIRELHFLCVRIAAERKSATAKKPMNSAVGGEETHTEDEGSCANQRVDAISIAIRKLSARPRTIPTVFQTAPSTSAANPNGTTTDVSRTAGMFATGSMRETG